VKRSCEGEVGVVFSAGVDSTLIAYLACKYSKVTAYAVGVEGAKDMEYARRLQGEAPFEIKCIQLGVGDVESAIPAVLSAWPKPNPLDVGVGIPMHLASKAAAADGLKVVLCGQGGDELFGGYWRYLESMVSDGSGAVADLMERDFMNAPADNLDRDRAVNAENGVELRFPYLDGAFSDYVRGMPLDLKIREDGELGCDEIAGRRFVRKYALKKLALEVGVPEYIVERVKKAAQYGSGVQKTLDKLARQGGFKDKARQAGRKDYIQLYLEGVLSGR
jgi:asparagine synthase (glutamine-hydrolysing)